MSKKFLKVFGLCVMAILLPILVVVSVVCLTTDSSNEEPSVETYVVGSQFAEETTVYYDEAQDIWKIGSVPVRDYYTFTGIEVHYVKYPVTSRGVVSFASSEEKNKFEADIRAKYDVTSTWECVIEYLDVYVVGELASYPYCLYYEYQFDFIAYNMETTELLTTLHYEASFEDEPIEFLDVKDNNSNNTIHITFDRDDKTESGDITIKTLLDKLAMEGFTLQINNRIASITIS